jgi:hypothetical protein
VGWHEQLVQAGVRAQNPTAPAVAHELTDFQADFLGAKQELLAARTQIGAVEKFFR